MGFAAGVLAAAVMAAGPTGGGHANGVNLTAYLHDGYRAPATTEAVQRIADAGLGRAAVVVTWYVDDASDPTVERDPRRTPSDASVIELVRAARAEGLWVLVKPQVDARDGSFRGDLAPSDPAAWWASYRAMIDHYATLADRAGADALAVGVELRSLSREPTGFEAVIAGARERFDGALTYAANWDEAAGVAFWPSVDLIGVDAYYPLATRPGASVGDLQAAWRPWIEELGTLSEHAQRPVLLTELGYPARPLAAVDPAGAGTTHGPHDVGAQARAYEAAVRAWHGVPWLQGIVWWDWPIDARDAQGAAYSPVGRPAERLLAGLPAAAAPSAPATVVDAVPWPLLVIVAIWVAVGVGFLLILRAAGEADRRAGEQRPPAPRRVMGLADPEAAGDRGRPPAGDAPRPRSPRFPAAIVPGSGDLLADLGPPDVERLAGLTAQVLGAEACRVRVADAQPDADAWPEEAATPVLVRGRMHGELVAGRADGARRFGAGDHELLACMAELVSATLAAPGGPWPAASARAQLEALETTLAGRSDDERMRAQLAVALAQGVAAALLPRDVRGRAELVLATRLHDVGMLRVPRTRLRRPARLSAADVRLVESHPGWGSEILASIPGLAGVAAIVRFHQERPDGLGYPHGLEGARVPRASLAVGACAAWAAMVAGAPHAAARTPAQALAELRRHAGTQFDAEIVETIELAARRVATLRVPA